LHDPERVARAQSRDAGNVTVVFDVNSKDIYIADGDAEEMPEMLMPGADEFCQVYSLNDAFAKRLTV
jgi:hypothetical protein